MRLQTAGAWPISISIKDLNGVSVIGLGYPMDKISENLPHPAAISVDSIGILSVKVDDSAYGLASDINRKSIDIGTNSFIIYPSSAPQPPPLLLEVSNGMAINIKELTNEEADNFHRDRVQSLRLRP